MVDRASASKKCPNNIPILKNNTQIKNRESGQHDLNIMCWNIRKGLITRELELKLLLSNEKVDLMFITETDTRSISCQLDYQIEGYVTIMPKLKEDKRNKSLLLLLLPVDQIPLRTCVYGTIMDQLYTRRFSFRWRYKLYV